MREVSSLEHIRQTSYVFLTSSSTVRERILRRWGIEPIVSEVDGPGEGLLRFMRALIEAVRSG